MPLWLRMLWKQPWEPHPTQGGRGYPNAYTIVWLAGLRKMAGVGRRHHLQKELGTQVVADPDGGGEHAGIKIPGGMWPLLPQ